MIGDAPGGGRGHAREGLSASTATIITIKVVPRAGNTAITGTRDNAVLVRLAAAPVEGAVNAALIKLLSELLGF